MRLNRFVAIIGTVLLLLTGSTHAQQPETLDVPFTTTTVQAVATINVASYRWVSVQVLTQGGSSTITFETSNNGSAWESASLVVSNAAGGSLPTASTTTADMYHGPLRGKWFRLNVSGIASGTTSGIVTFYKSAAPEFTVNANTQVVGLIPSTGATNLGKAEDGAHTTADVGVMMLGCRNESASQTTGGATDYACPSMDGYGTSFSRQDHPNRIHCVVTVSTATTLTAVGGSCAAPGAGLSIYVTDILFATNAGAIAADSFNTLKYGTGGTCGSGTAVFWGAMNTAAAQTTTIQSLKTPIKIPANNEICWINSTAGSKFITIDGFIAP